MSQLSFSLNDEDSVIRNHAFFNGNHWVIFRIKIGFYPIGGGTAFTVPLPDQIMDTLVRETESANAGAVKMTSITTRDLLAFMTEYIVSIQFRYFQSQIIGADSFYDNTVNNFGGLAHMAIQNGAGAFTTVNGSLVYTPPATGRTPSVAFSTLATDMLYGQARISFILVDNTVAQMGIVFRALDATHYYVAVYTPSTDKITVELHTQGAVYVLGTSAALSWAANITTVTRYFSVEYGNTITVKKSDDGITWTVALDHLNLLGVPTFVISSIIYSKPCTGVNPRVVSATTGINALETIYASPLYLSNISVGNPAEDASMSKFYTQSAYVSDMPRGSTGVYAN